MLTLIRCRSHPRVTAVARKRFRSFWQKRWWQLHLNTHTPLTLRGWSGLTTPLCMHSTRSHPKTSSHAHRQGTYGHSRLSSLSHWTDSGIKSGISVRELISIKKKKIEHSNILKKILAGEEKATRVSTGVRSRLAKLWNCTRQLRETTGNE